MKVTLIGCGGSMPGGKSAASPADICIYGGAAGGGKTTGLILEPLRHVKTRRADSRSPSAIPERSGIGDLGHGAPEEDGGEIGTQPLAFGVRVAGRADIRPHTADDPIGPQ